ncbi:hypothetical protein IFM89_003037 [Coptis chinensis]|uniref:Pentatricopeptide repeat-containing protein n=1 Tax=Coptis chinensis TaxID=261450 RepID=A0A835M8D0_9MAGN|nr:hypothetical protein IFM89_003037 [Coptis chinensis]
MYASCGDIVSGKFLFDEMPCKNLVSWNSMIDGYAKCGDIVSARGLFELMPERDVVSWSSLIDGYVKSGDHLEALEIFERMRGRIMQKYVQDNRLPLTLVLRTSLVDMYAKCGAIDEALRVFRGVRLERLEQCDVFIWNAMIGGLATHGLVKESLELFREMQKLKVIPDEITYLSLLSACAHGGLVQEAWYFFNSLSRHGMTPMLEHSACMVDVLSRAGYLDEAFEFLNKMPVEPTASMLGALLSGCVSHGRLDIGEIVGRKLVELEPENDGRYIGLANVYSIARRWEDTKTLRKTMEKRGVKKSPGCSSVEVHEVVHKFIAGDKTHPQSTQIYLLLKDLSVEMKLDSDNHIQDHISLILEDNG